MSEPPAPRALMAARIVLVVVVAVGLTVAHQTGALAAFGEPAELRRFLIAQGGWGQLAFVVAFAALQPFGVPGTLFLLVAPLLWPWPEAFALTMIGTMAASVVGFSFSRFVARDWVKKRIPARLRKYDEALEKRGFATVVTLRFIFWMPPALHAFFGISRVPFWTHFWGSVVGYAVPLFLMAYFGERLFDLLADVSGEQWTVVAIVTVVFVAIVGAVILARRRRRPREEPSSQTE
jgi:uncharacterized membrane protein YdjX (TVP38/TMEM64 family)